MVLHTLWGGRVNRPYALALEAAWKERHGADLEIFCDDDCVVLQLPGDLTADDVLALVTSTTYERHLRKRLESTGLFGALFREAAGRALLVTRRKFIERLPLWMSRLGSQKLLESVREFDDFPLLVEAWRGCLEDEFDLPALERMLLELESGSISVSEIRSASASPMARGSSFKQVNAYMYRDDQPRADGRSKLRSDLIDQLLFDAQLRPELPVELCARFEDKRRRLFAGYAVRDPDELLDWVKERGLVPLAEWERMLALAAEEQESSPEAIDGELVEPLRAKLCRVRPASAASDLLVALELRDRWIPLLQDGAGGPARLELLTGSPLPEAGSDRERDGGSDADRPELSDLLREWLEFYGPRPVTFVQQTLGIDAERLAEAIRDLSEARQLVFGRLLAEGPGDEQLCDTRNFEMLLRIARAEAAPSIEPLPATELAPFLGQQQGLIRREREREGLGRVLDRLCCLSLPAKLWESDVLTARVERYRPEWLDAALRETELMWIGESPHSLGLVFESDLDLWSDESAAADESNDHAADPALPPTPADDRRWIAALFRDPLSRYDFATMQRTSGLASDRLERMLWEGAFAGMVTSDGFDAVRRGLERKFEPLKSTAAPAPSTPRRTRGGRRLARRSARTDLPGAWRLVPQALPGDDRLEREERNRERVRLLLERHGILFRELLEREAPPFRWRRLFSSLRLMELSGEIVSGSFIDGIQGLQFSSHAALRSLLARPWRDAIFWLNAADPASPCGLKLLGLPDPLPRRLPSTHLTYHGAKLVLVSQRNGRELDFRVAPDAERMPDYLGVLLHLMTRPTGRIRQLLIERINGEPAPSSPYVDALRLRFELFTEPKLVVLAGR
jgi:ATP-dependent Lhr-like helicase